LEQDVECDKNEIVKQGLIEELHLTTDKQSLIDSAIDNTDSTENKGESYEMRMLLHLKTRNSASSVQHLSYLFKTAIKSRQQEILNWYYYSLEFENRVHTITTDGKIKDKIARTMIYKEMKPFLPNITQDNLRKKTLRARKLLMLFGENGVGMDKIKLTTYSANEISKLTNVQIQNIIDQVNSKTVPLGNDQTKKTLPETEVSTITTLSIPLSHTSSHSVTASSNSEDKIIEEVSRSEDAIASESLPETETKVSLSTESHVSDLSSSKPSQKNNPEISHKVSCSAEVGVSSNPIHDHAYFRNKILLRYSDLYKTFITEKFDYYDIIEGSLCPVCKLNHEDGKSVKGRYEAESYFIICGKREIEITT
jgi:hypothetical protein